MRRNILLSVIILFSVGNLLSMTQKEIWSHLIKTSSIADRANTNPKIFEEAAAATFTAMQEMPWGTSVPEREFKYFVIPLRVNNEPIDNHRPIIYKELQNRVKGLSMKDAILEVNHWCHEYVTYEPSDARTHSPLQSMSSCTGRCGEESTFTVAALRAVGIPARQVYTPRWAHTDDNHAWVEAWADGQWHFIGACEPEPFLDMAWFNEASKRGMMMYSFVRGDYDGPEEVLAVNGDGVIINVTENYAPVSTTSVTVVNSEGHPVEGADVSFRLYNYAEFFPLSVNQTDKDGKATIITGKGDLMIWASYKNNFGFTKVSAGKDQNPIVRLEYNSCSLPPTTVEMDITPPRQDKNTIVPDEEAKTINDSRLAKEDSIRNKRTEKFITPADAEKIAFRLRLPEERIKKVFKNARGNGKTLAYFLENTESRQRGKALILLENISAKDRSDITLEVLQDHLNAKYSGGKLFPEYVMSPRIENEYLSAWRNPLSEKLPEFKSAPALAEWIKETIKIIPDWTPNTVIMNPEKLIISKKGNERSRNLLFVAAARTLGMPARIDPVTEETQWADSKGNWHSINWEENTDLSKNRDKGYLRLTPASDNRIENPAYYTHFTISKITEGNPGLLEYDETANYMNTFSSLMELECGDYMLVTGQRLANGGVLSNIDFFKITKDNTADVTLKIRHDDSEVEVIGSFNSENKYTPIDKSGKTSDPKSILSETGRGFYVLGIVKNNHEPSNHALRDIATLKEEFEKARIPTLILIDKKSRPDKSIMEIISELPSNISFGQDKDGKITSKLIENLNLAQTERPIFIIADSFGRIVFVSQGYSIGSGRALIDKINRLNQ